MHASLPKHQQPGTPDTSDATIPWIERLAVWPVAAFALAIVLLLIAGTSASFEHPRLLLSLDFLFSTLVSLAIAAVAGRSFMGTGHPALLLLGCGALIWGLSATAGPSVAIMGLADNQLQSNVLATLHATCGWLSAMLHLTATTVAFKSPPPLSAPRHWLAAAYLSPLALAAIVAVATLYGKIPLFYVSDLEGTAARQMVLGLTITMFLLAAIMLQLISRQQRALPFARWYSLALVLFATGVAGILFQNMNGSPVDWAGRSAIYLGGLYLLRALFPVNHECAPHLIASEQITGGLVRQWAIAIAIAVVGASTAMVVRLYFLQEAGSALFSMTFVPAVMLASFWGGYRAGLATVIFSVVLICSILKGPVGQTIFHEAASLLVELFFLVSGLLLALAARGILQSASRTLLAEAMDTAAAERNRLIDLLKISEERLANVITERNLFEKRIQEQKTNFHNLVETTTDLIVVANFAGEILFSNAHFKKRLEYSQEELDSIHLLELHPPEMRQEAEAIVKAMLCGEQEICPLPVLTKSGQLVPVETRAWAGQWNGQDCLVGFIKDLSVEQEAQQRFERLFHSNPVPMALLTWPDRRLVDVNEAFLTISGFPKQDVIGKQPRELGIFRDLEDAEMLIEALARQGRFSNIELRIIGKHGNVLVGLFSGELINNQGKDYLLATVIDITERKWMEETLRIRDATLTAIIENQPGLLWLKDPESRFLAVNSQFARMCGLQRPEDVVGKTDLDVWPPELAGKYCADDQMIIQSKQPLVVEELVSDQGEAKWFETFKTPIFDDRGKVIGTTGYARNITARKQTEAALQRANDTALAAVVAQNKLLSTVAHEFRTPLMLLQSSLEILDRYSNRLTQAKRSMQEQRIRSAARQLIGLANTVLTYTRMEQDTVKARPASCDIGKLCRVIAEETQAAWAEGHRFEMTIGCEKAALILDPVLFRRILENLLANAFRYTPSDRAVFLKVNRDGGWLCLTIADEGIGIEEEDQPHVFELLFRGRNVGQSRGMGMGLSIVSESVQQMEGTITLHSALGLGTTFVVQLPWREVSEHIEST